MEILHWILNLTVVPGAIGFLFVLTPTLWFLRTLNNIVNYLFPEDVKDRVVVITGASSGIGEHMAYQYAKKGAKLVIAARREDLLRNTAQKARSMGSPDVLVVLADVTKEEDCKKIIDTTVDHFHRVDHLVLNAGITHSFLFEEAESTEIKKVLDVTFWGAVYTAYFALPWLKRSKGHIVVISSVASYIPYPRMAIYNAAKAGVLNFFDTLRVELGTDVNITIAMPGWVESDMTAGKFVNKHGDVIVDKEARDMHVGPWPIEPVVSASKAIVNGALRRYRYVIVPYWYSTFLFYRIFASDAMDFIMRTLFVQPVGDVPPSKKILDATGAQKILYPKSIQENHPKVA